MSATRKLTLRIHNQISNDLGRGNPSGHGPIPCGLIALIQPSLMNITRKAGITTQAAIWRALPNQLTFLPPLDDLRIPEQPAQRL
jgi:hypothetical protein